MALQLDTRKTTLLDFTLRNEQALNALYILGTPGGQTMTLELTNATGEPLDLLAPAKDAVKPYQFELVFRPGVLNEAARQAIAIQESSVKMSQVKNADGTVSLLLTAPAQTLVPGAKLTCTLLHVAPDGRLGSRGTRVLLRYANVQVHGADTVVGGFRETHLNIVTHVGKADIPLHVGVVGAGKVLNNGKPNLPLTLRISNTSPVDDIMPGAQPVSNFYLSFETGQNAEEWALGTAAQVAAIQVLLNGAPMEAKTLPGQTPEWVIPMPALPHGAYFDVVLNKLATQHPAGLTKVHLRYDNIPGYWDGQFVTQLEKSPLTFAKTAVPSVTNVGIGTATPITTFDVRTADASAAITVGATDSSAGAVYLGNPSYGVKRNYQQPNDVGLYTTAANLYLSTGGSTNSTQFVLTNNGNVAIGKVTPTAKLHVAGQGSESVDLSVNGRLSTGDRDNKGGVWLDGANTQFVGQINATTLGFYNGNDWRLAVSLDGNVGIGTASPEYPLDIAISGPGYIIPSASQQGKEASQSASANRPLYCVRASGKILAGEFERLSDARLKTVVGHSNAAADLALLNRLRITDYIMRDRVQYGDQVYKKLIAQELEEVFPQAVRQHTSFLPDIYARPSQVQRQGEALLITLPAGLPQATTAGQRLKLIGPAGEVLATLVEAAGAGSQQLLVSEADSLADTPNEVFVFGLEHPDVRTVDYEAVAMLNVSATQALAQQVQEMKQALPELMRRLESQDAKVAQYEQLVPALAETLKQQQCMLEELRAQVQRPAAVQSGA